MHLLVRSLRGCLSEAMQLVHGRFVQQINERHGWDGSLFRGRFESKLVEEEEYLRYLFAYVHLNPVRHGFTSHPEQPWPSSYLSHLGVERQPNWLSVAGARELFGDASGMRSYTESVHRGEVPAPSPLALASIGIDHEVLPPRFNRREAPESVLPLIHTITGSPTPSLRTSPRGCLGNPARRFAVWALRESTTLSYREIGELLAMSPENVGNIYRRLKAHPSKPPLQTWQRLWDTHLKKQK